VTVRESRGYEREVERGGRARALPLVSFHAPTRSSHITHVVVLLFAFVLDALGQVHDVVRQLWSVERGKLVGKKAQGEGRADWKALLSLTGFFMSFTAGRTSLGRVLLNDFVLSPIISKAFPVSTTSACFVKRKGV
jgi:hypothetical protein